MNDASNAVVNEPAAGPTWTPPGPGSWEADTAHFDPTVSRLMRDLMEEVAAVGLAEGFELAGAPLRTIQARFVNGQMYFRQVPLVGAGSDRPPPPKPMLWAVTRLHPAFRKRTKRSAAAIDERYWMQEFDRWDREWKPQLIETNRRLGEVDVVALGDGDLASHLARVWEHLRWAGALHFRLHTSDLAPIGRLLVAAEDWGLDDRQVMATLAGSSPATSAPARQVEAIAAELHACGIAPTTLGEVRDASDRCAELLAGYLGEFGHRLTTGYDIRNRTLVEMPDVVLASIRTARPIVDDNAGDDALDVLLGHVALTDHAELIDLVGQARTLYGLRDENGPLTVEWPGGVARHAVVEIGRRLCAAGRIVDAEHVFDLSVAEMRSLLGGAVSPDAPMVAARCVERMGWADLDVPATLGPVHPPPDTAVLPGRMAEMMRAILRVTTLIEREQTGRPGLTGIGVGTATYRGIARVVADADEAFERAEPGDIIVTRLTVPTFNSVLAMAGGVVTEGGGLLSHTAVIARELGIPAVIGVVGALTEIPDGAEIELDPVHGVVHVL